MAYYCQNQPTMVLEVFQKAGKKKSSINDFGSSLNTVNCCVPHDSALGAGIFGHL